MLAPSPCSLSDLHFYPIRFSKPISCCRESSWDDPFPASTGSTILIKKNRIIDLIISTSEQVIGNHRARSRLCGNGYNFEFGELEEAIVMQGLKWWNISIYGVRVTSPELRAIVKHVSVASMEVVLMIMKDDIKERRWHLLFRKMEQIYLFGDQLLHNQAKIINNIMQTKTM